MDFLAAHVRTLTTAVWVAVLVLLASAAALGLKWGDADAAGVAFVVELGLFMLGFTVLGVLIARREPHNAVGWLFCAVPIGVLAGTVSGMYAESGLRGDTVVGWFSTWTWESTWKESSSTIYLTPRRSISRHSESARFMSTLPSMERVCSPACCSHFGLHAVDHPRYPITIVKHGEPRGPEGLLNGHLS